MTDVEETNRGKLDAEKQSLKEKRMNEPMAEERVGL